LKLFEEKYDLGSASLSEVLKQKVQYGNDKLAVVQAEKTLEIYFDNLALDIGIDPQTDFDIAGVDIEHEPVGGLSELTGKALREHPSISSARENITAYKYDVRSAWGWYLPVVTGSFSYGWSKDQFSEIVKLGPFDHSSTLRLSVGLTLFDGFTRERNLVRAKVGLNNAKASHYYTRNQVIRDVEDAYLGINLANEILSVTEETERAAAEDFDLVQEKYNLGAAALWELLDSQVSLREAQFNRVKAEFDYNLALARLQNAMGK
jgi:outer membrane protein TolC